jgi:hypothetical protein
MQLRSGATTGETAPVRTPPRSPSSTPGERVPDQIEIHPHKDKKWMYKSQHQGHLSNHHNCMQQELMWQTLEDHHLNQQTSGHLNSHSYLNQITGQQENLENQEMQDHLMANLMHHLLSLINQQSHHHRTHTNQEMP